MFYWRLFKATDDIITPNEMLNKLDGRLRHRKKILDDDTAQFLLFMHVREDPTLYLKEYKDMLENFCFNIS